jgi:hypothetical protein
VTNSRPPTPLQQLMWLYYCVTTFTWHLYQPQHLCTRLSSNYTCVLELGLTEPTAGLHWCVNDCLYYTRTTFNFVCALQFSYYARVVCAVCKTRNCIVVLSLHYLLCCEIPKLLCLHVWRFVLVIKLSLQYSVIYYSKRQSNKSDDNCFNTVCINLSVL